MQLKPKVHMVILMENNLEEASNFYIKLGLDPVFEVPDKWAEFNAQGVKIGLAPTTHDLPDRHTGVVFEVDNLAQFAEYLKKQNISFYKEPVEALHGIMASIKDPGNNIIDLYQPTPQRLHEAMDKAQGECDMEEDACCKQD